MYEMSVEMDIRDCKGVRYEKEEEGERNRNRKKKKRRVEIG